MATYVLIHGAGSDAWYWHLVIPLLHARGHDAIAMDLPCDDDTAGLAQYTDAVVDAIGDRPGRSGHAGRFDPDDLVLVAQSLGGFTAPLVATRVPVRQIILVAAMVPAPGESAGDWWANTDWPAADTEDLRTTFFHDVPPELTDEAWARGARDQSGTPFGEPWPLAAWPDVPTRFILCRDDRFFPASFQRRVVGERLGIVPEEMSGGHLPALAHPEELVALLCLT